MAGRNGNGYIPKISIPDLSLVIDAMNRGDVYLEIDGYKMGISSARMRTYTKGTTCVCCGLEAKYFSYEVQGDQTAHGSHHLNLYAIHPDSGRHIMMTSDHIIAKSRGGSNSKLENRQPMCVRCNTAKGSMDWEEFKILGREGVRKLQREAREVSKERRKERRRAKRIAEGKSNKVFEKDGFWYGRKNGIGELHGPFPEASVAHIFLNTGELRV